MYRRYDFATARGALEFFSQAEDGIRYHWVTGVQTCALPISAHVITGNTAPPGHEPYRQASCESVLAGITVRDDGDLSAIEQIRQAQDWSAGTGHLLTLWRSEERRVGKECRSRWSPYH